MVSPQTASGTIAAFFDVDRTLIRGSSLLALARPLRRAGLLSTRTALRALVRQAVFSRRGFTDEQIRGAIAAVGEVVSGMNAGRVRAVCDEAIPRVVAPRTFDEAWRLLEWHRRRGDLVFLVSSSPHELIDRLGDVFAADGVVATDAEVSDGRYTGRIGRLCQGPAKAEAVRELAETHGIDLRHSYAYGDSMGDLQMLALVGHPACVNPDARLIAEARARGWRVLHFRRRTMLPRLPSVRRMRIVGRVVDLARTRRGGEAAARRP